MFAPELSIESSRRISLRLLDATPLRLVEISERPAWTMRLNVEERNAIIWKRDISNGHGASSTLPTICTLGRVKRWLNGRGFGYERSEDGFVKKSSGPGSLIFHMIEFSCSVL